MSTLAITNNTITLGSTIYQIRNITSVGKYRLKPTYLFKIPFIIFCGFLGWLGFEWIKTNPDVSAYKWFTGIVIILSASGILERMTKTNKYGLAIETNSGGARLISSQDQGLIDSIINKIIEVMNNRDVPVNYTFNIPGGDIINQTGLFENGVRLG
ncbi:MAG: hypothetical protein HC852_00500 [Acaryochloridaceae cyanobacterium RU_4_10]|nr:hypothetical protein [Acaryochloridaceae cyanobacterium RU_4_10]